VTPRGGFPPLPRPVPWRLAVQLMTLLVVLGIGWQFAHWVDLLQAGRPGGVRPPGVEGFLPISALISLRAWFLTGRVPMTHPAALVLLLLIVGTALLLKKAFCGWLCPVGVLAEWLARAGGQVFGRRLRLPRALDVPLRGIKYLLLFFFLYAVFVQMTPLDIQRFLGSPYNKVVDILMLRFFRQLSPTALAVLGALTVLSFVLPYFWCRYLCPYGALLGLTSVVSPLKVRRDPDLCTSCGECARICPSYLPVDRVRTVHAPECIGCLECVAGCPAPGALEMRLPGRPGRVVPARLFAVLVVALFFGGIGAARLSGYWRNDITRAEYQRPGQADVLSQPGPGARLRARRLSPVPRPWPWLNTSRSSRSTAG